MNESKQIVVIVAEKSIFIEGELQKCSFPVIETSSLQSALKEIKRSEKFLLFIDKKILEYSELHFLKLVKGISFQCSVIFFEQNENQNIQFYSIELQAEVNEKSQVVNVLEKIKGKNKSKIRYALEGLGYSVKQTEILEQLSKGECNKKIAEIVNLSEQGVKYHVGILLKDFEVANRKDLQKSLCALVSKSVDFQG